ncbi:MAG: MltA domain-containing protein [Burkholderiaceae bacterium]|nr:MltA domain-containing protein [Burkholderiaceae bacterium]
MRGAYRAALFAIALAGCGGLATQGPTPVPVRPAASAAPPPSTLHPGSRWLPAAWSDLPGWDADRTREAWLALQRSCERLPAEVQRDAPAWLGVCHEALRHQPADDTGTRAWLTQRLTPYRVLPLDPSAPGDGLATGYFEPQIDASRTPRGALRVPLHAPPADLATRRPWFTRAQIQTWPAAQAGLRGREIAYVADPLDALLLQVQGSGRLRLIDADGRTQTIRLAFAGHNDQPYQSIGRWLIDQGEIRPGEASWPAIRDWARRHPGRVPELLAANPRVVFFREEPLPDAQLGPRGAQGVALTPERSIAVDPKSLPYGSLVWLDTSEPLTSTPLRRLVLAQDTGSAITGAVRADYFWGWSERAGQQAGRMKQSLRMWVLWPR